VRKEWLQIAVQTMMLFLLINIKNNKTEKIKNFTIGLLWFNLVFLQPGFTALEKAYMCIVINSCKAALHHFDFIV